MAAAVDDNDFVPLDGGCTCGAVRYRMTAAPLFVHCCHCRWCQRETGSSFALNALIEPAHMQLLQGTVDVVLTPSASGRGQKYVRCPHCRVALWSHYAGAGDAVCFVRVGTLDTPDRLPPDLHMPAVAEYYEREAYWPAASLARWRALRDARASES
jgi:hypothetical protein